ncbi:MAG: amidase [Acidimicrobiia bacterium]
MTELVWPHLDISEAATGLRQRTFGAVELLESHLQRIEQLDPTLNAFITRTTEQAYDAARATDRELAAGGDIPPLGGIPLAIKDIFEMAGVRTTAGSPGLRFHIPQNDSDTVARLRLSAASLIGKTNLDELAFGGQSMNDVAGATLNPWDGKSVPGGSSGGSGAAVSAGMCMAATGSDTGGSIRNPSAWCGVSALKPTYGAISPKGVLPLAWSMDTVGFFARTVADLAILFAETADDLHDRDSVSRGQFVAASLEPPDRPRVALISNAVEIAEPGARTAYMRAIESVRSADIEEIAIPGLDDVVLATITILLAEGAAAWEPYVRDGWAEFGPPVRGMIDIGRLVRAVDYLNALRIRETIVRWVDELLGKYQFIVMPAMGIDPRPDVFAAETAVGPGSLMWELEAKYTSAWNLTGLPVVTVPIGFTDSGWPVVTQVIGRAGTEAQVLGMARLVEMSVDLPRTALVPTWAREQMSKSSGD